jgi:hypothetical protein
MHRHEMQQSNIYLGIYIIDYNLFWKIRVLQVSRRLKKFTKLRGKCSCIPYLKIRGPFIDWEAVG